MLSSITHRAISFNFKERYSNFFWLYLCLSPSCPAKTYMSFWFKCFDIQSYWRERKGNETGQIDTSTIPHRPGGMLRRKFSGQAMSEEIMIEFLVFDFTKFDMQSELASRISTNHFLQEAELWVILYSLFLTNPATLKTYNQ